MSFNINNSSYSAYLNNNTSFSSNKISKMEEHANKSKTEVAKEATSSITLNGKTYYIVNVDGESYMYDYENDTYSKFNASNSSTGEASIKETTYNAKSDSITVADSKDKEKQAFSYSNGSFGHLTTTKDNNIFAKNVAVVDDYSTKDQVSNILSHGELVQSIVEAGGANVIQKKIDANANDVDESGLLEALNDISRRIDNGEDIDAVNLSLSVATLPDYLIENINNIDYNNVSDLKEYFNGTSWYEAITTLEDLANKGVSVHLASGNEANDRAGLDGNDANKTIAGYAAKGLTGTGRSVNAFNLLTLAGSKDNTNIHVIGATDKGESATASVDNSTDYSNYNELVDKLFAGQLTWNFVKDNGNGTYKFEINGIGKCDIDVSTLTSDQLAILKRGFVDQGTSFSAPYSIASDDSSLK